MKSITKDELKGRKIALLGSGIETISLAKYLFGQGITADIFDKTPSRIDPLKSFVGQAFSGDDYLACLKDYDIVVRSPGFPLKTVKTALDTKKALITSPIELFMMWTKAKIIGVTGTKGKGTVSSLIYEMLKADNRDAYLAGNIGMGVFDIINRLTDESWVILELSSFQLEEISISPHIAVMIEIVPDHLAPLSAQSPNFHASFEDYVNAKTNIISHQSADDWAVLFADSETPVNLKSKTKAQTVLYSGESKLENGVFVDGQSIVFNVQNRQDSFSIAKRKLLGAHNALNIASATTAAVIAGIPTEIIEKVANTFAGLPHRLQIIAQNKRWTFVDDSLATGPASTIAALKSFEQPIALIAGGSSKGADFTELAQNINRQNVVFVALVGQEGPKIAKALEEAGFTRYHYFQTDFATAIKEATKTLTMGVVLLSPSCASMDMFADAKDRGDQFAVISKKLLEENGA